MGSGLMLKNSEKSMAFWMPEDLHDWFIEYLTNTAMEAAFQKAETACFRWSLRFF